MSFGDWALSKSHKWAHSRAEVLAGLRRVAASVVLGAVLAVGGLACAAEQNAELRADEFRFLRAERWVASPNTPDTSVLVGLFRFRYSRENPLPFWGWGPVSGDSFRPRFTQFRVRKDSGWESWPVGYCGTGASSHLLEPGVAYTLTIPLDFSELAKARQIRVSLNSSSGTFWSEPFEYPMNVPVNPAVVPGRW